MNGRESIDPKVLARIRDLRFLARRVIEGMMSGIHKSEQRGAGLEFSQFRNYQPGDDPRHIDWKLFARSDRYFVRESHRESQLAVWFLIDCSASMSQPSGQIEGWRKIDYARAIVASLAYLANSQGDAFGLVGLNTERLAYVSCRRGQRHFDRLLIALEQLDPNDTWPSEDRFTALWEQMRQPGPVVLISDFFQQRDEIQMLVEKLSAAGKELIAIQLLTADERQFPYAGTLAFVDRESGETLQVDASGYRDTYLQRFDQALKRLDTELNSLGVEHVRVDIEQPLDEVLWHFLRVRQHEGQRTARS